MNKFHTKYKKEAMAHFAEQSYGIGEKKIFKSKEEIFKSYSYIHKYSIFHENEEKTILEREEEICEKSIDDKFKEYSAQQVSRIST